MSIASTRNGENDMIFMVDKTARFFIDYDTNQLMAMRGGDAKGTPADVAVHDDGFVIGIWHDANSNVYVEHQFEMAVAEYEESCSPPVGRKPAAKVRATKT